MGLRNAQYHAIMREYEKRQLKDRAGILSQDE